jgi:hypothetical protein
MYGWAKGNYGLNPNGRVWAANEVLHSWKNNDSLRDKTAIGPPTPPTIAHAYNL